MQSQVSEIDAVTVEIRMEVPWDRVRKGLDEAFQKLQRTAHVKGFRPGKAPRAVIQKVYARGVKAELTTTLIEESLVEAVRQHEIPVVSRPVMGEEPEITEGQALTFSVKAEVRPKVEQLNLALTLERPSAVVPEAEVDAEIARLRDEHAVVRPIEGDRASAKGDVVAFDHAVEIDGADRDDLRATGRTVQIGEGRVLPELEEGLTGLRAGESRTIVVARPADDKNAELAGKKVVFQVTATEVRERILPELDDEFAKDAGEYQTLAELRQKTRERLEEAARSKAERALRDQAIDKLVAAHPIPVPPSLLDQQLRSMVQEYLQVMKMIGQQPELNDPFVETLRQNAADKVRAAILLGEVSRKAAIEVSTDEVEARLREIAERTGKHIAKIRVEYAGEKREALETQLLEDKLVAHLLSVATITDAPAAPAKE